MMLYPAMSELLEQVPSRYKLVNVVAARAPEKSRPKQSVRTSCWRINR